ncbi:MAG: FkbM family methyltransferase [Hoeflea sp.]|nr:FkbM family methyltransferase [Hoeflea sp.]
MGRVYAFEPLPTAFSLLKTNLAKNNIRNVIAYNMALGEYNGTTDFVFVPEFPEYSGFKKRIYHDQNIAKENITVELKKMDDIESPIQKLFIARNALPTAA